MKKKHSKKAVKSGIVRFTYEEAMKRPVYFDKAKIDAMTDEDIARQIAEDPDTAPDMTTLPDSCRVPVPATLRRKLGMTQEKIAKVLHISVGTWRNWEQGRSFPYGPAIALLRVLEKSPKTVLKALN